MKLEKSIFADRICIQMFDIFHRCLRVFKTRDPSFSEFLWKYFGKNCKFSGNEIRNQAITYDIMQNCEENSSNELFECTYKVGYSQICLNIT